MSPTVLIVEDDYIVAFDVAAALIDAGYEVAAMTSSEVEALDVASRPRRGPAAAAPLRHGGAVRDRPVP
jgi:CheY-like chemotaxis protein